MQQLAIVANALTPYRVHYHRRIAREIPQIKLWTVCTHEGMDQAWKYAPPPEINAVQFGPGESVTQQSDRKRALHEWKKGRQIIEWIKEQKISAVVVNGYNDAARLRVLRWCHRNNVPVMLFADSNSRGDLAQGLRAGVKRLVVGRIVDQSDAVLVCGSLGREYFLKYGAKEGRIFYTPYEPDYDAIAQVDEAMMRGVVQKYGLPEGRRRIVFTGRLVEAKRPDLAVDAFAAIADERPEWDLVIVGSGKLQQDLMTRVPQALQKRVYFTGFIGDQAEVSAIYRLSHVLVLPSDYEPWALVINEAAAAGMAIVCSDVVGAGAELVRDGVNGYRFPAGDGAALIEKLRLATEGGRIEQLRAGSAVAVGEWRAKADPVEGLRQALIACGVLGPINPEPAIIPARR
jgi:glycosyltransferase involved in cell wall biosynthesis